MARNTFTLDGVPLTDPQLRWFFESRTGLRIIPSKRMANISYPGRDGDAFIPSSPFLPGGIRIRMYVSGANHQEFMNRVEYLNALFLQRHKLLELRHDYDVAGTDSRHAMVSFNSTGEIEMIGQGAKAGILEYMGTVHNTFWRSINSQDWASPEVTATPNLYEVSSLHEGNAPVDDALIRVKGGFSELTVEDFTTKSKLVFKTSLNSTEYIIVDTRNWTARKVTTNTWTGGTNVDALVESNRGMGSMFVTEPSINGEDFVYRVNVSAVNPVGAPIVEFRAKKSFL